MSRPSEDDRDAVDRAFADLVAGFHLTAERTEPPADQHRAEGASVGPDVMSLQDPPSTGAGSEQPGLDEQRGPDTKWADEHPLFHFSDPVPVAAVSEPQERFVPEPPLPITRPAWPVLVAWLAMGYAVLAVLATALRVDLPSWAGWAALVGFVGGFGLLVTRLPRHRPPDAGDGAVL